MFQRNYFVLLALSAGLLLALLDGYLLMRSRQEALVAARQRNSNIAKLSSERLAGAISEIDYIMRDVHDDVAPIMPRLRRGQQSWATKKINAILYRKIETHPWIFGFGVMNARGIFVAGVDREGPVKGSVGADRSFREYFSFLAVHPKEDAHSSGAFQEMNTRDIWFAYSRAIRKEGSRQFLGVIYAGLYAKNMAGLFGDGGFAKSGALAVVDGSGKLLLHIPHLPGADGRRAKYPELDDFLAGLSTEDAGVTVSPWDGQIKNSSFHKVAGLPYTIVASSSLSEDLALWRSQLRYHLIGVLLIILLLLGIALLAGRLLKAKNLLEVQAIELERQAKTDVLTGISNRRHFFEMAERELMRARRSEKPMAMLMIDIDHFKKINDRCGHGAGDEVLKSFCITSQGMIRNIDVFGRIGGEEFAIVLPETNLKQAETVAERLRDKLSETHLELANGERVPFTVSIGVSVLKEEDVGVEELLKRADAAMYRAKKYGRNRVCIFKG